VELIGSGRGWFGAPSPVVVFGEGDDVALIEGVGPQRQAPPVEISLRGELSCTGQFRSIAGRR
jgi:hypothetical protein